MQTSDLILAMLLAGILAGSINFFIQYVELPFAKATFVEGEEPPKLKDIWWVAVLGYILVGCAGSFLTPLMNALLNLKGLEITKVNNVWVSVHANYRLIYFGYAVVFGYSTTRLLTGIVSTVIRQISKPESKRLEELRQLQQKAYEDESTTIYVAPPTDVKVACELHFNRFKADCSGFAKAVGKEVGINLTGQADDIVNQIQGSDWTEIISGVDAKEKAENGWFVLAGLKGKDNVPAEANGHVAVIVGGPLDHGKYPTGYWGKLGGVGEKAKTINYAWNRDSRDRVTFAGRKIS